MNGWIGQSVQQECHSHPLYLWCSVTTHTDCVCAEFLSPRYLTLSPKENQAEHPTTDPHGVRCRYCVKSFEGCQVPMFVSRVIKPLVRWNNHVCSLKCDLGHFKIELIVQEIWGMFSLDAEEGKSFITVLQRIPQHVSHFTSFLQSFSVSAKWFLALLPLLPNSIYFVWVSTYTGSKMYILGICTCIEIRRMFIF